MKDNKIIEIAKNKKAYHDYEILERYEAGIALKGTEIKSVREHEVNLKDSFVLIHDKGAWAHNIHINPYGFGNIFNHDPRRMRRLLLHKKEIVKLAGLISRKGVTLVPLSMYIKGKHAKLQIGVAKGKRAFDKREAIRERDIKRDMDREMKNYNR